MPRTGISADCDTLRDQGRTSCNTLYPLQSAQRSKARKLRHIMQLEDEVQSLQGLTQQQAARIGALQQDNALLSARLSGRACCPPFHACRHPALPTSLMLRDYA